jgi:hypothetical protein
MGLCPKPHFVSFPWMKRNEAKKNQVKIKLSGFSNQGISPIHAILTRPHLVFLYKY